MEIDSASTIRTASSVTGLGTQRETETYENAHKPEKRTGKRPVSSPITPNPREVRCLTSHCSEHLTCVIPAAKQPRVPHSERPSVLGFCPPICVSKPPSLSRSHGKHFGHYCVHLKWTQRIPSSSDVEYLNPSHANFQTVKEESEHRGSAFPT